MKGSSKVSKKNKRILVTGGAGFIGSNLTDFLIKKGYKVYVVDNLSTGNLDFVNPKAEFLKEDISDIKTISQVLIKIKPFAVHHVAALPRIERSVNDPVGTHKSNVLGTLSVLESARLAEVKKFIFSSSSSVYGIQAKPKMNEKMTLNPISHYAIQKQMAEMYCSFYAKRYGMSVASLRYFNVYGRRQPDSGEYSLVIGKFLNMKKDNVPMTIYGDGKQTRDYTFIEDVVSANYKAMNSTLKPGKNLIMNIGFGKEVSVNDLAKIVGGPVKHIFPNPRTGIEERRKYSDSSLAKKIINWNAKTNVADGIAKLIKNG